MASLQINLSENISWGDYLLDGRQVTLTVEVKKTPSASEPIHIHKEDAPVLDKRAPRMPWCKRGNSCKWSNCKFRHERCVHHDRWIARGCSGPTCRSLKYDPLSNKCPADSGCMYDHRDPSDLKEFIETVELFSHDDVVRLFGPLGLRHMYDETYDSNDLGTEDTQLLIRSLKRARDGDVLMYSDEDDEFIIHFID